jgi:hypothetical protein
MPFAIACSLGYLNQLNENPLNRTNKISKNTADSRRDSWFPGLSQDMRRCPFLGGKSLIKPKYPALVK